MTKTTKSNLIAISLIVILGLIAYGNTLSNGFVYDDPLVVEGSTFITSLSNLRHFFDHDYYLGSGETSWRVMVTLTYFIDYQLWAFNPFGYHLTNLIFHILNGILFYVFLLYLIPAVNRDCEEAEGQRSNLLPLLAALIFISHPIQTESVNSIGFRHEVVFSFFFFASLIFYLKARLPFAFAQGSLRSLRRPLATLGAGSAISLGRRRIIFYGLSLICYLLAMLAKEMAMVLPLVIVLIMLLTYIKDKTKRLLSRGNLLFLFGYLATLGVYIWVRFFWLVFPEEKIKTVFYGVPFLGGSPYICFLTTARIFASYLKLFLFPIHLTPEYLISVSNSIWEGRVLFSLLILTVVFILILRNFKRAPLIAFSGLWIFIPLITVSNIVPLHHPMAERYVYLSTAGFALFLAFVLLRLYHIAAIARSEARKRPKGVLSESEGQSQKIIKKGVLIFLILLFSLYSLRAITYSRIWKDKASFWRYVVLDNPPPHRARSYSCLGLVYFNEDNYDQAEAYFKKSLRQGPYYPKAHSNLGLLYCKKGDWDKGIEHFKKALSLDPSLIKVHSNLGLAYLEAGRTDEAINYYQKAIGMNPYLAKPYSNLGQAYLVKGDPDKAIENFKKALQLNPHMGEVYSNLGRAYWVKGNIEEAVKNYKKALKLNPNLDKTYSNLAQAYSAKGMLDQSIDNYKKALELNPAEFKNNFNLGLVYLKKELFEESIREFKRVVEIIPDFGAAYYNLAIIYHRIGNFSLAIQYCDQARDVGFKVEPDFSKALEPYR